MPLCRGKPSSTGLQHYTLNMKQTNAGIQRRETDVEIFYAVTKYSKVKFKESTAVFLN